MSLTMAFNSMRASQRLATRALLSRRAFGTSLARLNEPAAGQGGASASDKATPTMDAKLTNLEKWLVFKYSSQKYASINDVPDAVSKSQLYYVKDKARARMTIILIGVTILGAMISIFFGKSEQKSGRRHTDEIIKEHAQYSQAHRDLIRHSKD